MEYVIEGSVGWDGNRLRVRMQLSDASGFSVWPYDHEGELDSLFAVQEEIVSGVADALSASLGLSPVSQRAGTHDIEAYELYIAAKAAIRSGEAQNAARQVALDSLERALEIDAKFAPAWAMKSAMHVLAVAFSPREAGREALAAAEQAASRAIDLAPDLGEAYDARGFSEAERGNWSRAERLNRQAASFGYV